MTSPRYKNSSKESSSKKVILIDLDDTLINTSEIKERLLTIVSELDLSTKEMAQFSAAFQPFDREKYILLKGSSSPKVRKVYREYLKLFTSVKEFNFPGAEEMLSDLRGKYSIYLVTYGDPYIQRKKIAQSGLKKLLKKVIFAGTRSKEKELSGLASKFSGSYILDDEPYVCEFAKRIGFIPIQIKKGKKDQRYYQKLTARMI